MDDFELRYWIYRTLADTGRAPTVAAINSRFDTAAAAAIALRRLHDAHVIVLDDDDLIMMALPFANRPTGHRVVNENVIWDANCAWDSLAIPVALSEDATIESTWLDTGQPVDLAVRDGEMVGDGVGGFIHFAIPAQRWWDDIVET